MAIAGYTDQYRAAGRTNCNPVVLGADLANAAVYVTAAAFVVFTTLALENTTGTQSSVIPLGLAFSSFWVLSRTLGLEASSIIHSAQAITDRNLQSALSFADLFIGYTLKAYQINGQINRELLREDLKAVAFRVIGIVVLIGMTLWLSNDPYSILCSIGVILSGAGIVCYGLLASDIAGNPSVTTLIKIYEDAKRNETPEAVEM